MEAKHAICVLWLHVLILQGAFGNGRVISQVPKEHNSHEEMRIEQVHSHSHSSHMHHMDPALIVFFFLEDLKLENTIPVYFPRREPNSSPHSLPKEEADSIPFSSEKLENLLQLFSFSRNSPQAVAMEDTLRQCETKPIVGETKTCATSYESMLDFTKKIFGSETKSKPLFTTHITKSKSNILLQKYTIKGVDEISAPKSVACHTMPYPYAVFYCHYQKSESRVFSVSLNGENGDKVEAIAVCHMDTSQWTPSHVAFKVLGVGPGTTPVCHFFPSDNLVWVPYST